MPGKSVLVRPVGQPALDQFQRDTKVAVDRLNSGLALGRTVGPVAIGTGDTQVSHGLGRPAVGFFITDSAGDVRVFRSPTGTPSEPDKFIVLRASSAATVTLWVF